MRARYFLLMLPVVFFAAFLSMGRCSVENRRYFHSQANGYSVAIPEGWKQVPNDVMNHTFNAALTEEARKAYNFEAALAVEWIDKWLRYPYLLIQVIEYSDSGIKRPLTKNEITYFLKAITGLDMDYVIKESMKKHVSEDMRSIISDVALNKVFFDEQNMVYRFAIQSEIATVGKVRGLAVGHIGRYAAVQLMFYCLEPDWPSFENKRNFMFGSFHFDPGMRYEDAPNESPGILNRLGEAAPRSMVYV